MTNIWCHRETNSLNSFYLIIKFSTCAQARSRHYPQRIFPDISYKRLSRCTSSSVRRKISDCFPVIPNFHWRSITPFDPYTHTHTHSPARSQRKGWAGLHVNFRLPPSAAPVACGARQLSAVAWNVQTYPAQQILLLWRGLLRPSGPSRCPLVSGKHKHGPNLPATYSRLESLERWLQPAARLLRQRLLCATTRGISNPAFIDISTTRWASAHRAKGSDVLPDFVASASTQHKNKFGRRWLCVALVCEVHWPCSTTKPKGNDTLPFARNVVTQRLCQRLIYKNWVTSTNGCRTTPSCGKNQAETHQSLHISQYLRAGATLHLKSQSLNTLKATTTWHCLSFSRREFQTSLVFSFCSHYNYF